MCFSIHRRIHSLTLTESKGMHELCHWFIRFVNVCLKLHSLLAAKETSRGNCDVCRLGDS